MAARTELVKVGITVGQPRWTLGYEYERLPLLAPYGLFRETDRERFTRAYCARLDAAGLNRNWSNTQDWKLYRVTHHDHNPVHDAMGNVEAFERILSEFGLKLS